MAEELQSWVNYYARAGFGHHIYTLCCRQLQKRPHHPILLFWQAFGAVLEGLYIEGLQILEVLQENKELRLGVLALKLHVQHCHGAMEEKVEDLHQQLTAAKEVSSEKAMLHAATVYWNLPGMHNLQKAKELIQRIWTIEPQSPLVKCIRGWIILKEINCQNSIATKFGSAENALECFDDMISESTHIDGFLGKSYYYEIGMDYAQALSELNQAIVNYPKFLPALCEKGRVGLLMQDWDVVQETSQYILTKDSENIDGLRLRIHWLLCHENNVATAASLVADLLKSIDLNEPHNANLYYEVSKSIAAIVGRRQNEILHKTINLVQRAQAILPEEVSYVVELANQLFLLADYTSAIAKYRKSEASIIMHSTRISEQICCWELQSYTLLFLVWKTKDLSWSKVCPC